LQDICEVALTKPNEFVLRKAAKTFLLVADTEGDARKWVDVLLPVAQSAVRRWAASVREHVFSGMTQLKRSPPPAPASLPLSDFEKNHLTRELLAPVGAASVRVSSMYATDNRLSLVVQFLGNNASLLPIEAAAFARSIGNCGILYTLQVAGGTCSLLLRVASADGKGLQIIREGDDPTTAPFLITHDQFCPHCLSFSACGDASRAIVPQAQSAELNIFFELSTARKVVGKDLFCHLTLVGGSGNIQCLSESFVLLDVPRDDVMELLKKHAVNCSKNFSC
jgi:hypothetical protein